MALCKVCFVNKTLNNEYMAFPLTVLLEIAQFIDVENSSFFMIKTNIQMLKCGSLQDTKHKTVEQKVNMNIIWNTISTTKEDCVKLTTTDWHFTTSSRWYHHKKFLKKIMKKEILCYNNSCKN